MSNEYNTANGGGGGLMPGQQGYGYRAATPNSRFVQIIALEGVGVCLLCETLVE